MGYPEPNCPCLAVALSSGQVQLLTGTNDTDPLEVDTGLALEQLRWSPDGSHFLAAGASKQGAADGPGGLVVEAFTYEGLHVRSLRVAGATLSAIAWEPTGLRIAVAVDSSIFFANVRPKHQWGLLSDGTVACAVRSAARTTPAVAFWDSVTGDVSYKPAPRLSLVAAEGAAVAVVQRGELAGCSVTLCNAVGAPIREMQLSVELSAVCLNETHLVGTSDDSVFVWRLPAGPRGGAQGSRRSEWIFSIDATSTTDNWALDRFEPTGERTWWRRLLGT